MINLLPCRSVGVSLQEYRPYLSHSVCDEVGVVRGVASTGSPSGVFLGGK